MTTINENLIHDESGVFELLNYLKSSNSYSDYKLLEIKNEEKIEEYYYEEDYYEEDYENNYEEENNETEEADDSVIVGFNPDTFNQNQDILIL